MRLILTILLVFVFAFAKAQGKDTIPATYYLDSANRPEMEKYENDFSKWFRDKYCKRMKIKITCAGCSRFIYDAFFLLEF